MPNLFQSLGDALRPADPNKDIALLALSVVAEKGDPERKYTVKVGDTGLNINYITAVDKHNECIFADYYIPAQSTKLDLEIAVELAIEEIERHEIRYE